MVDLDKFDVTHPCRHHNIKPKIGDVVSIDHLHFFGGEPINQFQQQ